MPLLIVGLSAALWFFHGLQVAREQRGRIRGAGPNEIYRLDRRSIYDGLIILILFLQFWIFIWQCMNASPIWRMSKVDELEFALELQWTPGVCYVLGPIHRCDPSHITSCYRDDWTIRYLTMGAEKCEKLPLFDPYSKSLNEEHMDKVWPSCDSDNEKLWSKVWRRYGTCCMRHYDLNSVPQYFDKTIALFEEVNLTNKLAANALTPSTAVHTLAYISSVLSNVYGYQVTVLCNRKPDDDTYILTAIRFCFDHYFKLRHCDDIVEQRLKCGDQIVYLDMDSAETANLPNLNEQAS